MWGHSYHPRSADARRDRPQWSAHVEVTEWNHHRDQQELSPILYRVSHGSRYGTHCSLSCYVRLWLVLPLPWEAAGVLGSMATRSNPSARHWVVEGPDLAIENDFLVRVPSNQSYGRSSACQSAPDVFNPWALSNWYKLGRGLIFLEIMFGCWWGYLRYKYLSVGSLVHIWASI
jgi:hypothetical protein